VLAKCYGLKTKMLKTFFKINISFNSECVYLSNIDKSPICKMNNSKSELGQYLRELRKQREETLHQVSKGTDIDSPMLSKIERGERLPTCEQLKRLATFYKVSEAFLKVKHTAEKILKEYGANETTYDAIQLVNEKLTIYSKKLKEK
jgi:HTH-type transcriptional regulator, competence development regulator